jgi:hypothetical protein
MPYWGGAQRRLGTATEGSRPGAAGNRPCRPALPGWSSRFLAQRLGRLQLEFEVEDVGELHFEAVGAAAVVAEVDLAQNLGGDLEEDVFVRAGLPGFKKAGGVPWVQGDGEVTHTGLVGTVADAV